MEVIVIAVRSKQEAFLCPHVITTSSRGEDFIRTVTGQEISRLATRFEAYCLAGVEGKSIGWP